MRTADRGRIRLANTGIVRYKIRNTRFVPGTDAEQRHLSRQSDRHLDSNPSRSSRNFTDWIMGFYVAIEQSCIATEFPEQSARVKVRK